MLLSSFVSYFCCYACRCADIICLILLLVCSSLCGQKYETNYDACFVRQACAIICLILLSTRGRAYQRKCETNDMMAMSAVGGSTPQACCAFGAMLHAMCDNRRDQTRQDKDKTRQDQTRQINTGRDHTRQDKTRQNNRRQAKTRRDETRPYEIIQGKARQDKTGAKKRRQPPPLSLSLYLPLPPLSLSRSLFLPRSPLSLSLPQPETINLAQVSSIVLTTRVSHNVPQLCGCPAMVGRVLTWDRATWTSDH